MIYQEMYGYLTIEDPSEQDKVWQSLSPQIRDYLSVFLDLMNQAQENVYYEKSKFYRLITEDEFENLRLVYLKMQSKDIVIDAAFEEEFKQAFIVFEKKAEMKAKMNQWRSELENEVVPAPISMLEQEPVFYSRQQKITEQDISTNQMPHKRYQKPLNEIGESKGGCLLITVIVGIIITIALYIFFK